MKHFLVVYHVKVRIGLAYQRTFQQPQRHHMTGSPTVWGPIVDHMKMCVNERSAASATSRDRFSSHSGPNC